jgi:hypothetical protein
MNIMKRIWLSFVAGGASALLPLTTNKQRENRQVAVD